MESNEANCHPFSMVGLSDIVMWSWLSLYVSNETFYAILLHKQYTLQFILHKNFHVLLKRRKKKHIKTDVEFCLTFVNCKHMLLLFYWYFNCCCCCSFLYCWYFYLQICNLLHAKFVIHLIIYIIFCSK